ncbi:MULTISPECIES: c-type cytochrome [Novosphingobium]|uniref:c-type cytochrome n=1 Tax=Novosphingobium TaxID=165696 RepID=UPI001CD2D1A4|nr:MULTISPECIES: cytochrome c [Novosphingobium]
MMKKLAVLSLVAVLGACSKAPNAEKPDGAENYALKCAGCHNPGPGHPGTMLLDQLKRPVPALIGRKDLELDYLKSVVRHGLVEMPPFRPTELSDDEIAEIYAYIKDAKAPVQAPAMPAKEAP